MVTDNQDFFDPASLADYLQVPLASVYAWRYKGEGPRAYKVGRHLRYRRSDVEKWLESQVDHRQPA